MRTNRFHMRVAGLLLLAAAPELWSAVAGHAFAPENCRIGAEGSPTHLPAQCLSLPVPEDRAHPAGRQIRLHVALLRALAEKPAADPLFFIAGGPGQAASEAFVEEAGAFERLRLTHDIVLVDQRGTGGSNRLDCPLSPQGDYARAAADCLRHLPGDPRFYTTSVAVRDLDAVRAALGYRQIDLYGISYGTRVALEYLRRFPSRTRSVVLDGVVPADLALGPEVSLDAQRALALIFSRCATDPSCHAAFPDPAADFHALQHILGAKPAKVTLRDPLRGSPRQESLTWEDVAGAVRLMSYQSETASLLPLFLHEAAAGDYAPLMGAELMLDQELRNGFAVGMQAAVLCTEDAPYYRDDPATAAAMRDTYLGSLTMDQLLASCAAWPRGVVTRDFKQPVRSDKPVLLLSGEDDPITPPADAAHAAKTLSNSLSLTVPGQGHGNAFRGCVPRLMAEFIDAASAKRLDTSCIKDIKPFPFFVDFTGPAP